LWHNVRTQLGAFEGTKAAALPTLGIKGGSRCMAPYIVHEPMSALVNSIIERAGAANGGSPPFATDAAPGTKFSKGLLAAIRCAVHEGPQWAETNAQKGLKSS
jgi:hypothetical protein